MPDNGDSDTGPPGALVVDTGLAGILIYEDRLTSSVPALKVTGSVNNVIMSGRLRAKQATLSGVLIGQTNREVPVLHIKAYPPGMLAGIDGVVGIASLNARRVNFDFVGKTLSWE